MNNFRQTPNYPRYVVAMDLNTVLPTQCTLVQRATLQKVNTLFSHQPLSRAGGKAKHMSLWKQRTRKLFTLPPKLESQLSNSC